MKSVFLSFVFILSTIFFFACVKNSSPPVIPDNPANTDSSHQVKNIRIHPDNGTFNDTIVLGATNIRYTDSFLFNGIRAISLEIHGDSVQLIVPFLAGTGPVTISFGNGQICPGPVFKYKYTNYVTTIGGTGETGSDDADGIALHATINGPFGVAVDDNGNVLVTEVGHPKIRKIGADGSISTLAGTGGLGNTNGPGGSAQFYYPFSIVMDKSGNAYVADGGNHNIRKITAAGVVSTYAGNGVPGYVDGPGATASFYQPYGLTIDPQGNLFVADHGNKVIRKIATDGTVSTVHTGLINQFMDGKDTAIAGFYGPWGVAADQNGNLYVSDGPYVRKILPDGTVYSIAGDGIPGDKDGVGHNAELWNPIGIVCDLNGNVFVSDFGTYRIKKIAANGMVTTIAGTNWNDQPFLDGPALKAHFFSPVNIALDKQGNIYVGDNNNLRVRKITMQ